MLLVIAGSKFESRKLNGSIALMSIVFGRNVGFGDNIEHNKSY